MSLMSDCINLAQEYQRKNDGQDIKSLVESLSLTYRNNLESGEDFEVNQKEKHLLIKYLEKELTLVEINYVLKLNLENQLKNYNTRNRG